jgi:hypothetical protein
MMSLRVRVGTRADYSTWNEADSPDHAHPNKADVVADDTGLAQRLRIRSVNWSFVRRMFAQSGHPAAEHRR